jgi:hypothetical protein
MIKTMVQSRYRSTGDSQAARSKGDNRADAKLLTDCQTQSAAVAKTPRSGQLGRYHTEVEESDNQEDRSTKGDNQADTKLLADHQAQSVAIAKTNKLQPESVARGRFCHSQNAVGKQQCTG